MIMKSRFVQANEYDIQCIIYYLHTSQTAKPKASLLGIYMEQLTGYHFTTPSDNQQQKEMTTMGILQITLIITK